MRSIQSELGKRLCEWYVSATFALSGALRRCDRPPRSGSVSVNETTARNPDNNSTVEDCGPKSDLPVDRVVHLHAVSRLRVGPCPRIERLRIEFDGRPWLCRDRLGFWSLLVKPLAANESHVIESNRSVRCSCCSSRSPCVDGA